MSVHYVVKDAPGVEVVTAGRRTGVHAVRMATG
jgi:hypothetical protein